MRQLNDFFLGLGVNDSQQFDRYLAWLRPYAHTNRADGAYPDDNGVGLRRHAINEMSMLAYFAKLYPRVLMFLPVIPGGVNYNLNRYVCNLTDFSGE